MERAANFIGTAALAVAGSMLVLTCVAFFAMLLQIR